MGLPCVARGACRRRRTWLNANRVHIQPPAMQSNDKALRENRPEPLHIGSCVRNVLHASQMSTRCC